MVQKHTGLVALKSSSVVWCVVHACVGLYRCVVVLILFWHTNMCQVFRSIGYKSVKVDKDIPFDQRKGVILNEKGRIVSGEQPATLKWLCMLMTISANCVVLSFSTLTCCLSVDRRVWKPTAR